MPKKAVQASLFGDEFIDEEIQELVASSQPKSGKREKKKKSRKPETSSDEEEDEDSSSSEEEGGESSSDDDKSIIGDEEGDDSDFDDDGDFEPDKLGAALTKLNATLERTSPKEDENWQHSTSTYFLIASLKQLEGFGKDPEIKINPESIGLAKKSPKDEQPKSDEVPAASLFASKKSNRDAEKEKPKEKKAPGAVMIGEMTLTAVKNNFPNAINIDVKGLNLTTKQNFSGNGKSSAATFLANTEYSTEIPLVEMSNVKIQNKFFEEHPGRNLGNIREGIQELTKFSNDEGRTIGTGEYAVDTDHPVVAMFNKALVAQGNQPLDESNMLSDQKYKLDVTSTDGLMKILIGSMEKQTQVSDVDSFKFVLSRACTSANDANVLNLNAQNLLSNGSTLGNSIPTIESKKYSKSCKDKCASNGWTDHCEVLDNNSGSSTFADKELGKVHSLAFTVRTKWKELGKK